MLERIRAAWHALRGYAAASDLRTSSWAPSSGSANAEVAITDLGNLLLVNYKLIIWVEDQNKVIACSIALSE